MTPPAPRSDDALSIRYLRTLVLAGSELPNAQARMVVDALAAAEARVAEVEAERAEQYAVAHQLAIEVERLTEVEAERDALRRREEVWRIEHRDLRGQTEAAEARAVKAERAVERVRAYAAHLRTRVGGWEFEVGTEILTAINILTATRDTEAGEPQ